jgi:hypothetical protein
LAFAPYISGTATFPKSIAPELSSAISEFLKPASVVPGPLDFNPRLIPVSSEPLILDLCGTTCEGHVGDGEVPRLRVVSAADTFGHQVQPRRITIPSNAVLLEQAWGDRHWPALLPSLAVAVLIAEDLNVGVLHLPSAVAHEFDRWAELTHLLRMSGVTAFADQDSPTALT